MKTSHKDEQREKDTLSLQWQSMSQQMARPRNFKGQDGRFKSGNKSSRSSDHDRHHGGSSSHDDHRDNRDHRDLKPLLAVDPGPSSLLNVVPTAYRYRYSSSSRVNANNYYRHNRFRMLNGHPLGGRLCSVDSTDSADGVIVGTSQSTSPSTELPSRPTTEPSAPPLELASPTRSQSSVPATPKVTTPGADSIDLPPTYDDVMNGTHLRKQLPFAPKTQSNSTPDIRSDGRVRPSGTRSGSQNEHHISEEEDEETASDPRKRKKNKDKKTAGSKIKKGLENIAFFLIQILD